MRYLNLKLFRTILFLSVGLSGQLAQAGNSSSGVAADEKFDIITEPDPTIRVYILAAQTDATVTTLSDCTNLSEALSMGVEPLLGVGEEISAAIRDFSRQWVSTNGRLVTQDNRELYVTPSQIQRLKLGSIDVPIDDWNSNPTLEGRDISGMFIESSCEVAAAVDYFATDLNVDIASSVTNWISDEAAQNQIAYDNETIEFFKQLYGNDGLGFGDFVKGGIAFEHMPPVPGAQWSYNEFALHWRVQEVDASPRAAELIPRELPQRYVNGWIDNCQPNTLRLASNPDFSDASVTVINNIEDCIEKPLFIPLDAQPIPENNSTEFSTYLNDAPRLHHLTFALDEQGKVIPCDERDPISFDGCSQPIVASFETLIKSFFKNESDLYLEFKFSQRVSKIFYINVFSGEVEEIESRFFGVQ